MIFLSKMFIVLFLAICEIRSSLFAKEVPEIELAKERRLLLNEGIDNYKGGMKWTFTWPYAYDGSCVCRRASYGNYDTESECLQAFESSKYESCKYLGSGISEEDCEHAVSRSPALNNRVCAQMCSEELLRNRITIYKFDSSCMFERYYVEGGKVKPQGECFGNFVYGWMDELDYMDLASFASYSNIKSASHCQNRCQEEQRCQGWMWRRTPEYDQAKLTGEPFNCYLKNAKMIRGALDTNLSPLSRSGRESNLYCDISQSLQCQNRLLNGWGKERCLQCPCDIVCVWRSDHILSGPKYCVPNFTPCNPPDEEATATTSTTTTTTTATTYKTTKSYTPEIEQPAECRVTEITLDIIIYNNGLYIATIGEDIQTILMPNGQFSVELEVSGDVRNMIKENPDGTIKFVLKPQLYDPNFPSRRQI